MRVRHPSRIAAFCWLILAAPAAAQDAAPITRYLDPINGLTLAQAIAEGLRDEPGLRETRTAIEAARGERSQAARRPNPSVSAERREEAGGTDNQTMVGLEVPLDLFRRSARVTVADRVVTVMERSAEDRERLLAADIRERIGRVLAAVRRLEVLDQIVGASRSTVELLDARVREGAARPLDRDVASVELQRLRASRELAIGQADAAVAELKPLLGLDAQSGLLLRDSLETIVAADTSAPGPSPSGGRRADVLEAEAQVAAADARVAQVRQEAKLDMAIFASYMRMDNAFPQTAFGPGGGLEPIHGIFHTVSGGVRIALPIFNRNQGLLVSSRARREGAAYLLDARRLAAAADAAAAQARDAAARRALAVYSARSEERV